MSIKPIPMPICELCDRLTIALLKAERLSDDEIDKDGLTKQIAYYTEGIDQTNPELEALINKLLDANKKMWDAEHAIRKGLDDDLGLEEIGRRAINIRDYNRERVAIKNDIADLVSQPEFKDCKMNHVSSKE
jgi:hypothetical protein